ncbi:MAG: prolyl oligopeptidase family serine peptidase [Actinomycetota bacterium]|nr:prolyl oligopeptidase family serine peptidase [Actinomycetota bacterium]
MSRRRGRPSDGAGLRALLFAPPAHGNVRLSPDGARLLWIADVDGVPRAWVGEAADPAGTGRPCTTSGSPVRFCAWAPDGDGLIHVEDAGGRGAWHLVHTPLGGEGSRSVTPSWRGADLLARSWDRPDAVLVSVADDAGLPEVHRYELATGRLERVEANPGTVDEWFADRDLRVLVATAATPDGGFDLLHRCDPTERWEPVLHVGPRDAFFTRVVAVPTDHDVLLVGPIGGDTAGLVHLDARRGTCTTVARHDDHDIEHVLTDPGTGWPTAYGVAAPRRRWHALDDSVATDLAALTGDPTVGDLRVVDRSRDDSVWLVAHEAADRPVRYRRWRRHDGRLEPVLVDRPALSAMRLSPVAPTSFTARDGLALHGYWTEPPDGDPPHPTVVLVHGGPWLRDQWQLDPWVQWIASLGQAVLQVDFRGSSGRGRAFLEAGAEAGGDAMVDDVADAIDEAVRRGWADAERLCAMGSSYGGYAALMLGARGRVGSVVAHAAPTDLADWLLAVSSGDPAVAQLWRARFGDPREQATAARLRARSPMSHVTDLPDRVVLAHGAHDPRVPRSHTDRLVAAMRAAGRDVVSLVFEDEGHEIADPANALRLADAVAELLTEHAPAPTA